MNSPAVDYVQSGFVLVPIPSGKKGPTIEGWNTRPLCISTVEQAQQLNGGNIGLAHAYSGTCSIDIDQYQAAEQWLAERGIDLAALLMDEQSVQIFSGRDNRAKLLYRLPHGMTPLPKKSVTNQHGDFIDFRCATASGLTVQDVLPPSIHPDTGKPYQWKGDFHNLPVLPDGLLRVWRSLLEATTNTPQSVVLETLGLSSWTIRLIREGNEEGKYPSRSEAIYGALKDLVKARLDDPTICAVMTDPAHGIAQKPLQQSNGDIQRAIKWIGNQIPKARAEVSDEAKNLFRIAPLIQKPENYGMKPISCTELLDLTFEELCWIVRATIPAGTMLFFGKPKKGKSFLALMVAMSVAAGQKVFGKEAKQRRVLYMGLEDSVRRLQRRVKGCANALQIPHEDFSSRLHVTTTSNRLDTGLMDELKGWMEKHSDTGLIVVDMLKKVTAANQGKNLYEEQAQVGDTLTRFCHQYPELAIMVVHHSRKAETDDPFDMVSGTTGLSGSYDSLAAITDTEGGRMLHITGRDIENRDIPLKMNDAGMYTLEGVDPEEERQASMSDTRRKVYKAVATTTPMSRKDVVAGCGLPGNIVDQQLRKLKKDGLIKHTEYGKYQKTGKRFFEEGATVFPGLTDLEPTP